MEDKINALLQAIEDRLKEKDDIIKDLRKKTKTKGTPPYINPTLAEEIIEKCQFKIKNYEEDLEWAEHKTRYLRKIQENRAIIDAIRYTRGQI